MMACGARTLAFAGWTVAGAGLCLGVLTGFTIGIVVLPAALFLVGVLLVRPGSRNRSAVGLVSGAGLVPLYIAYLNRSGPGDVCTTTRTERRCAQMWSPWPWLAVGLLLVAAGIALFYRYSHHHLPMSDRCRVKGGVV
jgi:hypothetical protein